MSSSDMNAQRIMVLGDSHGNTGFMMAAMNIAHRDRCDVVHVVGDFGIWTHVQAGVHFLDAVEEEARALGLIVTFTDGNHENFDDLYAIPVDQDGWRRVRPHIWHAPRGHIWRWGGINLMSMGGAHSIDGPGGIWTQARGPLTKPKQLMGRANARVLLDGMDEPVVLPKGHDLGGWWPQEVITDADVEIAINNMAQWVDDYPLWPDIDVLFAHDAPSCIPISGINGYPAGDENRAKLQKVYEVAQAQLLVHGHYHRFQQFDDIRNNCLTVCLAHDGSNRGQYMFIDTDPFEVVVPTWQ